MSRIDGPLVWQALQSLREELDAAERDRIASHFAGQVRARGFAAPIASSPVVDSAAGVLAAEGYCSLASLLAPAQVAEVVRYFRERPCFNAHVHASSDKVPRRLGEGAEAFHYGSYALDDVVAAPFLVELANSPALLAIAERYLGCTPTLYSLNAWWSFPGLARPAKVSQSFHRDLDDFRFCTLFLYLTDVDARGGPHAYVRRTHRIDLLEQEMAKAAPGALEEVDPQLRASVAGGAFRRGQAYGLDPAIRQLFGHLADMIPGPAGSGLIADTYGLHMGIPPESGPRLIFWARYGLHVNYGPNAAPVEERLIASRIPWDDRARYINRALLRS
ncbi:MAG: hypothetical protein FJX54_08480 [Alphaproteobacteria bacterium]|nr:hypothetical protein [Alphaproteobacteria bacterium]